jgi:putative lipoic acid-binding regulatory protein
MTETLYPATVLIKVFYLENALLHEELIQMIKEQFIELELKSSESRYSKNNNYQVLSLELYAESEQALQSLYRALQDHPQVKMVL